MAPPTTLDDIAGHIRRLGGSVEGIREDFTRQLADNKTEWQAAIATIEGRLTGLERNPRPESRAVSLPGVDGEKEKFSFWRAIRAIVTKDWTNAPFEKEVFDQTRKQRALSSSSDSAGGYLVPAEFVADLIELYRAKAIAFQMGVTPMDGMTGSPVEIPKQTSASTAYWTAENVSITASDTAYGQLQLRPHGLKALSKLPNRLMRLAQPAVEAIVRDDLARSIALALDQAILKGTGLGEEPIGVLNTTGIGAESWPTFSTTVNENFRLWDMMSDIIGDVDSANALMGSLWWAMNPALLTAIRKTRDANQRGFVTWDVSEGSVLTQTLMGYPFATSTQLAAGTAADNGELIFGDWSQVVVPSWGGLEFLASDVTGDAMEKDQTWVRTIHEVDVGVRHAEAFSSCVDVDPQDIPDGTV